LTAFTDPFTNDVLQHESINFQWQDFHTQFLETRAAANFSDELGIPAIV
jgi:hypothetical protein